MSTIVQFSQLSFSFGSTKVLSDISFHIEKGDFVGLIGPNGSGKTTLVKLLLGLLKPSSGQITVCGKKISHFTDWYKIGYVPQKVTNFADGFPATVQEIVLSGCLSHKKFPKKYSKKDLDDVDKYLSKVNMLEFKDRRISELSGGQQQRVFIARSLITQPQLLILDEPTTGVDQDTQQKFYELLGALNKERLTILLVSHDLSRITKYVTKVASLNNELQFYGSHDEFCSHPDHDKDHHCLTITQKSHCGEPHCRGKKC